MSLLLLNLMPLAIVGLQLSQDNFSLVYRAERINNDADALSRLPSTDKETLFNDLIRAVCHVA